MWTRSLFWKKLPLLQLTRQLSDTGLWYHFAHLVIYPRELDEKTIGFRGIVMAMSSSTAKPILNISLQLREITRQARYIYIYIPEGKKKFVIYSNDYSAEMYI